MEGGEEEDRESKKYEKKGTGRGTREGGGRQREGWEKKIGRKKKEKEEGTGRKRFKKGERKEVEGEKRKIAF